MNEKPLVQLTSDLEEKTWVAALAGALPAIISMANRDSTFSGDVKDAALVADHAVVALRLRIAAKRFPLNR